MFVAATQAAVLPASSRGFDVPEDVCQDLAG
jgi:hypothetical protein